MLLCVLFSHAEINVGKQITRPKTIELPTIELNAYVKA